MDTLALDQATEKLFEATLDALAAIDTFSDATSPTTFVVYAHDSDGADDSLGPAYSNFVKQFIRWMRRVRTRTYSDQHPSGLFEHEIRTSGDLACRDILENQFCLLPRREFVAVEDPMRTKRVETVVVCGSPRLRSYCKHPFANAYIDTIRTIFEQYSSYSDAELRQRLQQEILRTAISKPGFHHALTEIAFLELRRQYNRDAHGIILVSLEQGIMDYFRFTQPTNLQLLVSSSSSIESLHGKFFKLLRTIYTTAHAAIDAHQKAYNSARLEIIDRNSDISKRELDDLFDHFISRARRDLANYKTAELRQLYQRGQQAELGIAAYAILEQRRNKVLSRLPNIPYRDRKDRNPDRVVGTCRWFTKHEKFQRWHCSEASGILWVTAYPGCGKSVLLKHLVDTVLVAPQNTICYFFFKDDFEDQMSVISALRCLLHQVLLQRPELLTHKVIQRFEQDQQLLASASNLWDILEDIANGMTVGNIVIVLDALDECARDDRQVLMRLLVKWNESGSATRIKILISSRLYSDLSRGFCRIGSEIHLSAENDAELQQISGEIDLVIAHKFRNTVAYLGLGKEQQDLLHQGLTKFTHKTYLWVHLVQDEIDKIIETDKKSLHIAVQKLPESVDEAYEKILSRSGQREKVMRMLSIILAATEPLNLLQLAQAWAITPEITSRDELEIMSDAHMRRTIRSLCGLFVIVVEDKAYLLHQTAREFLLMQQVPRAPGIGQNFLWKESLLETEAELVMAQICLHFFRLYSWPAWTIDYNIDKPRIVDKQFHDTCLCRERLAAHQRECFAMYASQKWIKHVLEGQQSGGRAMAQQAATHCAQLCDFFEFDEKFVWSLKESGRELPECDQALLSPLGLASMLGVLPVVELLLEEPTARLSINRVDQLGTTALAWAVYYNHVNVSQVLLERGADFNTRDWQGISTLARAVDNATTDQRGDHALMEMLLTKGADPNVANWGFHTLWQAVGHGSASADAVALLLQHGAEIDARNVRGETALMSACQEHSPDVARLLLEVGADPALADDNGRTALMHCCRISVRWQELDVGWFGTVETLLTDRRVDLNACGRSGDTALSNACRKGHERLVEILLRHGAAPHARAVFDAVAKGNEAIVVLLREAGGDVNTIDPYGKTPLTIAASLNKPKTVEMLLTKGADIDHTDMYGRSALYKAAKGGFADVVVSLLRHGAAIDSLVPDTDTPARQQAEKVRADGGTPLIIASYSGHRRVAEILLGSGAAVDVTCGAGQTALHGAAEQGHKDIVKILLQHGATINRPKKDGMTALMAAVLQGHKEVAQILLSAEAGTEEIDTKGWTALSMAAQRRDLDLVKMLLTHGAEVNHADDRSCPALSVAAMRGMTEVVRLLLDKGADAERRDNEGWSALERAARSGHLRIMEMLLPITQNFMSVQSALSKIHKKKRKASRNALAQRMHELQWQVVPDSPFRPRGIFQFAGGSHLSKLAPLGIRSPAYYQP